MILLSFFPAPPRLLAAIPPPASAHGIPALVWLVLALNVAVVGFFVYRIVGLVRERDGAPPPKSDPDPTRRENPPPP